MCTGDGSISAALYKPRHPAPRFNRASNPAINYAAGYSAPPRCEYVCHSIVVQVLAFHTLLQVSRSASGTLNGTCQPQGQLAHVEHARAIYSMEGHAHESQRPTSAAIQHKCRLQGHINVATACTGSTVMLERTITSRVKGDSYVECTSSTWKLNRQGSYRIRHPATSLPPLT